MSRQRDKGTKFETQVVDYLARVLGDDRIEKRRGEGQNDRGDITGVLLRGKRVVLECKNHKSMKLSEWVDETECERGNDDAEFAFVVHHRKGCGEAKMGETYVTCTLENLAAVIAGARELLEG